MLPVALRPAIAVYYATHYRTKVCDPELHDPIVVKKGYALGLFSEFVRSFNWVTSAIIKLNPPLYPRAPILSVAFVLMVRCGLTTAVVPPAAVRLKLEHLPSPTVLGVNVHAPMLSWTVVYRSRGTILLVGSMLQGAALQVAAGCGGGLCCCSSSGSGGCSCCCSSSGGCSCCCSSSGGCMRCCSSFGAGLFMLLQLLWRRHYHPL